MGAHRVFCFISFLSLQCRIRQFSCQVSFHKRTLHSTASPIATGNGYHMVLSQMHSNVLQMFYQDSQCSKFVRLIFVTLFLLIRPALSFHVYVIHDASISNLLASVHTPGLSILLDYRFCCNTRCMLPALSRSSCHYFRTGSEADNPCYH